MDVSNNFPQSGFGWMSGMTANAQSPAQSAAAATALQQTTSGQTPAAPAETGQAGQAPAASPATADTLTLSVKTVFRQQASLAVTMQQKNDNDDDVDEMSDKKSAEHVSDDDSDDDDDHKSTVVTGLAASVSQSFMNVIGVTRTNSAPSEPATVTDAMAVDTAAAVQGSGADAAGQVTPDSAALPVDGVAQSTSVNAVSASRSLSSSLQLTTAEGDVVTVDISRSQSLAAGNVDSASGSMVYAAGASSSQLNISIQGDLSEKESEAIEHIIKRVNKLAEKLYSGEVGEAFGKLQKLEVDSKQLTTVALSMSSSFTFAAVSAYSQVGSLPAGSGTETTLPTGSNVASPAVSAPVSSPAASAAPAAETQAATGDATAGNAVASGSPAVADTATEAVQQTRDVVNDVVEQDAFENPFAEIRKLFASIADSFAAMNEAITAQQNDFIKQLFNNVVDDVEQQREPEEKTPDHEHDDETAASVA